MEKIETKLGKLCIRFSSLEFSLKTVTAFLIAKDSDIGQIVLTEMSFQNIVKTLDALLKTSEFITEQDRDALYQLIPHINRLEQERNKLVHSMYMPDQYQRIIRIKATAKLGKGLRFQEEEIDEQVFDHIIDEMSEIQIQLNRMLFTFVGIKVPTRN